MPFLHPHNITNNKSQKVSIKKISIRCLANGSTHTVKIKPTNNKMLNRNKPVRSIPLESLRRITTHLNPDLQPEGQ